jgi:dTDP-4-amino-4,6-dideoxy-D-galactose acyltransferase
MIRKLDWDSSFFGLQIGEYLFDSQDIEILDTSYDLIYVLSKTECEIKIKGYNQTFKENKLFYFSNEFIYNDLKSDNIFCFSDNLFSREELYNLSFESGKYSRFKCDKKFTEEQFKNLYKKWIDNSLDSDFADDVLVYVVDNKIAGFVTYKIINNQGVVGLIGVLPNYQGNGIGKSLIKFLESKLIEINIRVLRIPTQKENIKACSFYERLGYEVKSSVIIKHFWKNDSI